jgi:hypothetical protein
MSVIHPGLFRIFERFPDRKNAITWLFSGSEDFQMLCEDYRKCTDALQYWSQSSQDCAPERRYEYERILRELEDEIMQNLNKSEPFCE